jgi:aminopeptidase N
VLAQDAHHIVLHAKDLAIESVTVDGKAAEFAASENDELFITHPDLAPGKHIVVVGFTGIITDPMHGLYPCYFEHDGTKKELLATQFESHHAREVFPCVDEPAAKATFDLTLTTETGVTVLSNMPQTAQKIESERLVTTFLQTPQMSTYLLAWVVGELHAVTGKTNNDVEVSIWATPLQPEESLTFALDSAIRSIEFYEEYFDTPYPLPKSDHVALPDFSSGAMENWGLITYREVALLANPKTTSISSRQYIASVVAHELAHQWFGNLVTMQWWNDLWLNESFATLMTYPALDALYPEWNIWLDFTEEETIAALRRDSIDGVQPVQVDVHHPDEISTLFDPAIVYAKGARLLNMLRTYVGDNAFQTGLKHYFKDHAYKNTVATDLWNAIGSASDKDIAGLMSSWLTQPGYPVVHVTEKNSLVTLTQEQFFVGPHAPSDKLWPIPLNSSCDEMPILFDTTTVSMNRHHTTPLRFNIGDSAHFITHYEDHLLEQLITTVRENKASVIDRLQLLHEATLLARGGVIPTSKLIALLSAYADETDHYVWTIMLVALNELRKFVEDDAASEKQLRTLTGLIALKQYERLGWTARADEPEEDTKLRSTIIGLTLYGENQEAISTAKNIYDKTGLGDIDPELRPLIISSRVRYGDASIVDQLLDVYRSSHSGELQQDITIGITCTRIPEKITQLLEGIKHSDTVRPQDVGRWFAYLMRGRESRPHAWSWLVDNWQWITDTFGGDKSYDNFPYYSASALTKPEQLQAYMDFFELKKADVSLTRAITMGISEIEGRIALIKRDGPGVRKALADAPSINK